MPPPAAGGFAAPRLPTVQTKPAVAPLHRHHHGIGAGRPGTVAACCGLAPHPAPARPGVLQRMQQTTPPSFPISSSASYFFSVYDDVQQSDLAGSSNSSGRQNFYNIKDAQKTSNQDKFVQSTSSVVSFLKINGQAVSVGTNGKAGQNLTFHEIGYENQSGEKENFHAEDWCLESFKQMVDLSGKSLNQYLNAYYPPGGNTGQGGKHVFSIKISYSSCLGCVTTIRVFRSWLETNLGSGQFILRVKFLRPYKLATTTTNPSSKQAEDFISSIGGLIDEGIFVRMQPETSAKKLLSTTALSTNPDFSTIAVNHPGVKAILSTGQYNWLTKTWGGQGANRKGFATTSSTTSSFGPYYCGQQTLSGFACSRKVSKQGDTCWQHS